MTRVFTRKHALSRRCSPCAQLAKKRTAEKKLAITVFSFPPDKGNVGTAAYLNVFGSIYRVLQVRLCLVIRPMRTMRLGS